MKTALEVLHKYFHHFNSERTRDLVVKAMEDYAKIYHDSEVKKLNIPAVINSVCPFCNSKETEENQPTRHCSYCNQDYGRTDL
jgi:hypothetical protein